MQSVATMWMWIGFFIFVFSVLALDLFVLGGRKTHRMSTKEAFGWTLTWITLALIFNVLFWWWLRGQFDALIAQKKALEFLTGYLIEESLSFDNMFVILMIFQYFCVPAEYQRRVLLYGVLGAIVMRFAMILGGAWLIQHFHWILYLFGVFLLFTGGKMLFLSDEKKDLSTNFLVIWLKNHIRLTHEFHEEKFFVKINALNYATPLFLALVLVEVGDLVFALDSIPAIFAITKDPFIVFTSNIFAIMGLRAIYFLLANLADRFYLLKYGIALILIFVGFKMVIEPWLHIPVLASLSTVISIVAVTIILSFIGRKDNVPRD